MDVVIGEMGTPTCTPLLPPGDHLIAGLIKPIALPSFCIRLPESDQSDIVIKAPIGPAFYPLPNQGFNPTEVEPQVQ